MNRRPGRSIAEIVAARRGDLVEPTVTTAFTLGVDFVEWPLAEATVAATE